MGLHSVAPGSSAVPAHKATLSAYLGHKGIFHGRRLAQRSDADRYEDNDHVRVFMML